MCLSEGNGSLIYGFLKQINCLVKKAQDMSKILKCRKPIFKVVHVPVGLFRLFVAVESRSSRTYLPNEQTQKKPGVIDKMKSGREAPGIPREG